MLNKSSRRPTLFSRLWGGIYRPLEQDEYNQALTNGGENVKKIELEKIREKWTYEYGKFQLTVKEDMSFEDFLLWYVDMLDGEYRAFVNEVKKNKR